MEVGRDFRFSSEFFLHYGDIWFVSLRYKLLLRYIPLLEFLYCRVLCGNPTEIEHVDVGYRLYGCKTQKLSSF